jgi:hypothetical protein
VVVGIFIDILIGIPVLVFGPFGTILDMMITFAAKAFDIDIVFVASVAGFGRRVGSSVIALGKFGCQGRPIVISNQLTVHFMKCRDQTKGTELVIAGILQYFAGIKNFVLVFHLLDGV